MKDTDEFREKATSTSCCGPVGGESWKNQNIENLLKTFKCYIMLIGPKHKPSQPRFRIKNAFFEELLIGKIVTTKEAHMAL